MRLIRLAPGMLLILLLLSNTPSSLFGKQTGTALPFAELPGRASGIIHPNYAELYHTWNLAEAGLSEDAFIKAQKGYVALESENLLKNDKLLTIIDYSKPSSQKRLFVLDMETGKILFNSLVAHGRRSGCNYATEFSNKAESHKTSLGFYITLDTYVGSNGYSLKLKGCEKGINDKAYNRAIVMHGADYVSEEFVRENGYLGRSYGCPAVPVSLSAKIIDVIKGGTCMFLYYPSKKYISQSKILNS